MTTLFSSGMLQQFLQGRAREIINEIHSLPKSEIRSENSDGLKRSLTTRFSLERIALQEDKVYQKDPTEIMINSNSRIYGAQSHPGTRFTIVLPFSGDSVLLSLRPSQYDMNPPTAEIYNRELHFVYEISKNDDANAAPQGYKENVRKLNKWLENSHREVDSYNDGLNGLIDQELSSRKKNIDDNLSAANSFGIPIK